MLELSMQRLPFSPGGKCQGDRKGLSEQLWCTGGSLRNQMLPKLPRCCPGAVLPGACERGGTSGLPRLHPPCLHPLSPAPPRPGSQTGSLFAKFCLSLFLLSADIAVCVCSLHILGEVLFILSLF